MKTRLQKKLEEAMRVSIEHKEKEGLDLVVLTPPEDWAWSFEALTDREFSPRDEER